MSENVRFSSNQLKFIDWLATGKIDRDPPTQLEFAEKIGVSDHTLTRWKKGQNGFTAEDFWNEVTKRARELNYQAISDTYNSLREEATNGSLGHQKLLLELVGEYQEKTVTDHSGQLTVNVVYGSDD